MEAPISKFMHVQQTDNFWHQTNPTTAFKSPDLIELNSDSERRPVEVPNYSSSQEEVETEDDCCDAPDSILVKEGIPGVYDVSHDEESCHLLQTEDDSENSDSENENVDNSSKSSGSRSSSSADPTISDGETVEEPQMSSKMRQGSLDNYWDMTAEQEKYYTEQFLLLQPDISGMVNGAVAKGFFEKSKLPHAELREIWQISDVTKDGCLDLAEFKTAMHLVVLRRHNLHIPPHFYSRRQDAGSAGYPVAQPSNGVNGATGTTPAEAAVGSAVQNTMITPPFKPINTSVASAPPQPLERSQSKKSSKDWTTFENEPVNFSAKCDTNGLVAPVPVRRLATPEEKISSTGPVGLVKAQNLQLKAIQRPKLSGHHPKVSGTTIAPPPPPRRKTHVRSSSLDLNRLNISDSPHPPSILAGPEAPTRGFLSPSHRGGAFSVYRKPQPVTEAIHGPSSLQSTHVKPTKVQLKQEVVDLKNENTILNRISTQLLDQLSGLQAKKKALNSKIQQLNTLPAGGRIS